MKVNFFAPINDLGYGIHAYNTIREFEKRGHNVTLVPPLGQVRRTDEHVERWLWNRESFDPNAPGIMIFNEEYLTQFTGRPRIAFPVFELEKFTPLQYACLRSCDYIFTPTKWGAAVLKEHGFKNVRVVNEGFDPSVYTYVQKSIAEDQNDPFTFMHVGKFEERKGTLQALTAFAEALEGEEAILVMHVNNQFLQASDYAILWNQIKKLGFIEVSKEPIIFKREHLVVQFTKPVDNLSDLYKHADCGLFPTRAEGWGLPIMEMMAMGIPCIVGRWTGMSEYITEKVLYDFTIQYALPKPAKDGMWFDGTRGDWREPTFTHLVDLIQHAFKYGRTVRKSAAHQEATHHIRQFTWARAAEQMEYALREIIGL